MTRHPQSAPLNRPARPAAPAPVPPAPAPRRAGQAAWERAQAAGFDAGVQWGAALVVLSARRAGGVRRAVSDLAGAGWLDREAIALHLADAGAGDLARELAPATYRRPP